MGYVYADDEVGLLLFEADEGEKDAGEVGGFAARYCFLGCGVCGEEGVC